MGQGDNDENPMTQCNDCHERFPWTSTCWDEHERTCDLKRGKLHRTRDIYGDGIGYVSLVDTMGDQWTPAEDARMSTGRGRLGPEKDGGLQERLLRDAHTSPFEGVVLKFEICCPLFVLREIDRHRTTSKIADEDVEVLTPEEGSRKWFARNEMSGRYVQMPNEYYHPASVRGQSRTNKQGDSNSSSVPREVQDEFLARGEQIVAEARALYDWACEVGVERGLARIYNTQNQYTRIRMTGSLKNWFDFLSLRLPPVVLWECRRVADSILAILEANYPDPVRRWKNHVLDAVKLSAEEVQCLRRYAIIDDLMANLTGASGDRALLVSIRKKLGIDG